MKAKNLTILVCLASLITGLDAQGWTTIDGVIPDTSTAQWADNYQGSSGTGTDNENLVSALKSLDKDGKWYSYLSQSRLDGSTPHPTMADGTVDSSRLLSISGRKQSDWSYVSAWMQHYTAFDLPQNVRSAQAARVSFNVDFLGTNDTIEGLLDVEVLPWIVHEREIEVRRAALPGQQNYTKFLFGLMNIATGEFIESQLSNGQSMMFDYTDNNYFWTADSDGTLMVSFDLSQEVLASAVDGFALVIESTWGGPASTVMAEYYTIGDFKVEILEIPEPSTTVFLLGLGIFTLAGRQKRKLSA